MSKVVCDGDSIAYKAAFSTQYQTYQVEGEDITFRYLRDCEAYLALNFDKEDYPNYTKVQVLEPINHTLHIVNKIIEGVVEATKATDLIIYLSGDENYRKKVPYPVTYKGNRGEKPVMLPDIRKYLVERYKAIITDGCEADDAIGIYATENPGCIVASVDKDLRQIPGRHYHLDKKDFTDVSEVEGLRVLYRQMLTGDRTDNILGVDRIGVKTAEKLIDKLHQERDMYRVVVEKYKECFGKDWEAMFKSNYALLKVLTSKEEYENAIGKGKGAEVAAVGEGQDSTSLQPTG